MEVNSESSLDQKMSEVVQNHASNRDGQLSDIDFCFLRKKTQLYYKNTFINHISDFVQNVFIGDKHKYTNRI